MSRLYWECNRTAQPVIRLGRKLGYLFILYMNMAPRRSPSVAPSTPDSARNNTHNHHIPSVLHQLHLQCGRRMKRPRPTPEAKLRRQMTVNQKHARLPCVPWSKPDTRTYSRSESQTRTKSCLTAPAWIRSILVSPSAAPSGSWPIAYPPYRPGCSRQGQGRKPAGKTPTTPSTQHV